MILVYALVVTKCCPMLTKTRATGMARPKFCGEIGEHDTYPRFYRSC
jgi:hypothetical protein